MKVPLTMMPGRQVWTGHAVGLFLSSFAQQNSPGSHPISGGCPPHTRLISLCSRGSAPLSPTPGTRQASSQNGSSAEWPVEPKLGHEEFILDCKDFQRNSKEILRKTLLLGMWLYPRLSLRPPLPSFLFLQGLCLFLTHGVYRRSLIGDGSPS